MPIGDGAARRLRCALLWTDLPGYVAAELAALAARDVELLVFHRIAGADAPFELDERLRDVPTHAWSGAPDEPGIDTIVADFEPDVLLVHSWQIGAYRRIARRWRGRALRILALDGQWWGTLRQRGHAALAPLLIRPAFDAALVAGDRQAELARRLGFPTDQVVWGGITCDTPRFAEVAAQRGRATPADAFLFAGRLVPDRAPDVLAEAYRRYRLTAPTPWPLLVAGAGPEVHRLDGVDGVKLLGFVPPDEMPGVLADAGCLVLPSRSEPWGVVVHEAVAAGLPVVCTWVCGAATRLVLDGYNGAVTSVDDPAALAAALERISSASEAERRVMGEASARLAQQYTPERWADTLLRRIVALRARAGMDREPW